MNIAVLELHTTHSLEMLADFYTSLLESPPLERSDKKLSVQIGRSQLTFHHATQAARYHFAINIPKNQFVAAKTWLETKTPLVKAESDEEVFHSENWNADMMYFYDPAGNVLELIARHTSSSSSGQPFGAKSLLAISEIGIAADDVTKQVSELQKQLELPPYCWSGGSDFVPLGDENGLFIVVKAGRTWFPDTGIPAERLPVTAVIEEGSQRVTLSFS